MKKKTRFAGVCVLYAALAIFGVAAAQEDPLAHRKGTLIISTQPGMVVRVEQLRHDFMFGVSCHPKHTEPSKKLKARKPDLYRRAQAYSKEIRKNFNTITPGYVAKWHFTEKERGKTRYQPMDQIVKWAEKHDMRVRGHNVFWSGTSFIPEWVKPLKKKEALLVHKKRAREVVKRYKGRLVDWDFCNETLNGNHWEMRVMGKDIHAKMTQWVKKADPDCNVCTNEFGVLASERKCNAYVQKVKAILQQGGVVDALGCQGHYHGEDFDRATLRKCLDMLAELKRPILITEFNMPGQTSKYRDNHNETLSPEQEKRKAIAVRDYMRICFHHPSVEAFIFWGAWERDLWIPASALWKKDMSPTPALKEYRKLVFDKWWTRWEGKANEKGECRVEAFFGRHRIRSAGKEITVELAKEKGAEKRVVLDPPVK